MVQSKTTLLSSNGQRANQLFVTPRFGEFKINPEKKWFKTGLATSFSFSSSLFFWGGREIG